MSKESFINEVKPYAEYAGKKLSIDPNFIVAQWSHETGYGTNTGTKNNNLAGIMAYAGSPYGINGQKFNSLGDFTAKYISVLENERYTDTKKATTVTDFAKALRNGGYAEDKNYAYAPTWNEAYNISKTIGNTSYEYMTEDGTIIKDEKVIDAIGEARQSLPFENSLDKVFGFVKIGFANVILFVLLILFIYVSLIQGGTVDNVGKKVVGKVSKKSLLKRWCNFGNNN